MRFNKKKLAMLKSYLRSALAAVVAVMATIDFTWKDVVKAFVAALLPPIIRWLDPKDKAFGRTTSSR